jgi:hypothetical protein
MKILVFALMLLNLTKVYCAGVSENPVNVQEIGLENIDNIIISYNSEKITLFNNSSDSFIIKEYMSKDDKKYYAKINNTRDGLIVEAGRRPGFFPFRARVEIYIPASNKNITIKMSSGGLEGNDEYTASSINIESSSGDISINSIIAKTVNFKASSGAIRCREIKGNTSVHARSGSIVIDSINGNISAEASSGSIKLNSISGAVTAKASSGNIDCTIAENTGDITIISSSGGVSLKIPIDLAFNFSSKTSSGNLQTPFSDKLFIPISDKKSIQGIINGDNTFENQNLGNINIETRSGSIRINWIS